MSMTIKDLREIILTLPDETIILIEMEDIDEVETIDIQYHSDGRTHIILSSME